MVQAEREEEQYVDETSRGAGQSDDDPVWTGQILALALNKSCGFPRWLGSGWVVTPPRAHAPPTSSCWSLSLVTTNENEDKNFMRSKMAIL